MRLLSKSAFTLEFQDCVKPQRPLIAARVLLGRLELLGQRVRAHVVQLLPLSVTLA
jgi:hypothetical protein